MLRRTQIKNKFCTSVKLTIRPNLQMKFPELWLNTQIKEETRLEDVQLPQSVITQRLKFLANRNDFFKELSQFSFNSVHSSHYQQSLYDLSNFLETYKHSNQISINEKQVVMQGLKLFQQYTPEQIQLLKFHFDKPQSVALISFLEAAISLVKQVEQFQDSLFVNLSNNLFELFSDPKNFQKTKQVEDKLVELFNEIGNVFYKFDYLSSSQPLQISKILGQLFELIIINCTKPENFKHYSQTANIFIQKYYEIQQQKMVQPTIIDYKNILYTIFQSDIRPEALIQDAVDKFANCGIQNGNIAQTIDIMSMMLLYNIPCTENFLNRLKQSKRSRLTISQLFVLYKCYEFSKVPIYEFCLTIFQDVISYVSQDKWNEDANSVLMLGRICNGIFQSSFITSKFSVEKRNDRILTFVEKNVYKFESQLSFNHILFLSNVFNRHLSQPFFLNHYLHLKLKDIQISEFSLSLFNDFFEITYEFYKDQYTYYRQIFVDTAIQPTSEYQLIVKTFIDNLVHINLNQQLLLNILKVLSLQCFQFNKQIVHQYIEKFDFTLKEIHILAKVMQQYNYDLTSKIFEQLLKCEDNAIILESLYYICQQGNFEQQQKKKLQTLAATLIQQLIAENEQFLIQQREIDDFIHSYSPQINHQSFQYLKYIPVILTTLSIQLEREQINSLIQLFERTSITWFGDNLIINLILINKMNIINYNLFHKAAENLLTNFNFSLQQHQTPLAGLLEDDKIQMELLKAYLNQIKYSETQQTQGLKIIGYLAYLNFNELNNDDIMMLCKLLGGVKDMYYPQLQEYLKNPLQKHQLPNKLQLITFCSYLKFKNEQITQLLLDYLNEQKNIQLSQQLLQATQTQQIFLDNIDQLFTQLNDNDKHLLIKPIYQNLINTWDIDYSIDSIINFAESVYDQQDSEFKFIHLLLVFLNNNRADIKLKQSDDQCYYQVNRLAQSPNEIQEERMRKLSCSLNIKGLAVKYFENDSMQYYPSFFSSNNQNEKASYKISIVKKNQKSPQKKLQLGLTEFSQFIQHQINFHDLQPQYLYIDYFFKIQSFYDIDMEDFFFSLPKQIYNKRIQKIKNDNKYLEFVVTLQSCIEGFEENIVINTNIEKQIQRSFVSAFLSKQDTQSGYILQYLSENDFVQSKNKLTLNPLKLIESLALRQEGDIYLLNFQKWKESYKTKEKQLEFISSLFSYQ